MIDPEMPGWARALSGIFGELCSWLMEFIDWFDPYAWEKEARFDEDIIDGE